MHLVLVDWLHHRRQLEQILVNHPHAEKMHFVLHAVKLEAAHVHQIILATLMYAADLFV